MCKELPAECRAMKLIIAFGKKEAMSWLKKYMDIVEWVGSYDRIRYWGMVEHFVKTFNYE